MNGSLGLAIYAVIFCFATWAIVVSMVRALHYGYDRRGLRGWRFALYCPPAIVVVWAGLWLPMIVLALIERSSGHALVRIARP